MSDLPRGCVLTIDTQDNASLRGYLDTLVGSDDHILLISREPHRKLLENIAIDGMEVHWLTEREGAMTLKPDLKAIETLLSGRFSNHRGIAALEGIEWLFDLYGAQQVLSMLSELVDLISMTQWTLFLSLDLQTIEEKDAIRLTRECRLHDIASEELDDYVETQSVVSESERTESVSGIESVVEDGSPRLIMLTRLTRSGFTSGILRRRILQWRRMGLDVSALEPALNMQDISAAWELYSLVEEQVRFAVELDRRVDILSASGHRADALKYRFRIRMLNNLAVVERELEEEMISSGL